jgi:sugar/nucleoside kinase (ribokinase family)
MAVRFLAVGELLVDVIAAGAGHGARIRVRPAGSAFNAAVAAAAAGAEATVVGTVADDPPGRMIVGELGRLGIRADVAVADGLGPTGTFLLSDGEARVDPGVAHRLSYRPDWFEADVVLVSGYLPAAADVLASAEGTWVALDAARLDRLPEGGNAVFANEEGARRVTGRESEQAVSMLGERYRLACVTLGAEGAIAMLDGRVERAQGRPLETDALGAGDAYAATLLVRLATGDDLAEAMARATRAALDSLE